MYSLHGLLIFCLVVLSFTTLSIYSNATPVTEANRQRSVSKLVIRIASAHKQIQRAGGMYYEPNLLRLRDSLEKFLSISGTKVENNGEYDSGPPHLRVEGSQELIDIAADSNLPPHLRVLALKALAKSHSTEDADLLVTSLLLNGGANEGEDILCSLMDAVTSILTNFSRESAVNSFHPERKEIIRFNTIKFLLDSFENGSPHRKSLAEKLLQISELVVSFLMESRASYMEKRNLALRLTEAIPNFPDRIEDAIRPGSVQLFKLNRTAIHYGALLLIATFEKLSPSIFETFVRAISIPDKEFVPDRYAMALHRSETTYQNMERSPGKSISFDRLSETPLSHRWTVILEHYHSSFAHAARIHYLGLIAQEPILGNDDVLKHALNYQNTLLDSSFKDWERFMETQPQAINGGPIDGNSMSEAWFNLVVDKNPSTIESLEGRQSTENPAAQVPSHSHRRRGTDIWGRLSNFCSIFFQWK